MTTYQLFITALLFWSCDTGKLTLVADIPNHLKEVSAAEVAPNSNLIWVFEDAGNDNHLYALDKNGKVVKDLTILNGENEDWEDLTADDSGNIYIGDFGNNSRKRHNYSIFKITNPEKADDKVTAERIDFKLPKGTKDRDFEAFFVKDGNFYIFSKENKKGILIKVPNQEGSHIAEVLTTFELDGKHNKITSADISDDGKTVVLLNHDKLWVLNNFEGDQFFKGDVEALSFEHNSQKEGVCFKNSKTVYLTDERNGGDGGNLYLFDID